LIDSNLFCLKNMIINDVINYKNGDTVRFHMPGHKGRPIGSFIDSILPYDLTELPFTDDLFRPEPQGAVESSENFVSGIFGSSVSVYSVGGATLALQAAIAAVKRKKNGCFLCSRRVHMSIINALALCGIQPVWYDEDNISSIEDDNINTAAAVIITYENYYGAISDIASIKKRIAEDTVIIADNAHGSHLVFWEEGKLHPLNLGADLVVDSIHKTLPAMTGCALLHSKNSDFARDELKSSMALFSSTSPSYILMSSAESSLKYSCGNIDKFTELKSLIDDAKEKLRHLDWEIASYSREDPFRICLRTKNATEIANELYKKRVICEFSDRHNIVFIPSIMNTDADFDVLTNALSVFKPQKITDKLPIFPKVRKAVTLREALFSDTVVLKTEECVGKISARMAAPYPPGIPLIMPGEYIDAEICEILKYCNINEVLVCKD